MWKDGPIVTTPNYTYRDRDGDVITASKALAHERTAVVTVRAKGKPCYGVYVPADQAPALALAILESAGWDPAEIGEVGGYFARAAVRRLRQYVDHVAKMAAAEAKKAARAEAEAAAQRKLDEEAQTLYVASGGSADYWRSPSVSETGREFWRKVARAARAIHVEDRVEADAAPDA